MAGAKFRNIRVRMASGRTRLQRARVLASGKLKFVKNKKRATPKRASPKRAAKKAAKKRSKSSKSASSGGNRTTKQGPTIPVGLVLPGFTGTWITFKDIQERWKSGGAKKAFRIMVVRTTGIDIEKKWGDAGFWRPQEAFFTLGWGIGGGLHWGVGKKLKVNAELGRMKFPIFRV